MSPGVGKATKTTTIQLELLKEYYKLTKAKLPALTELGVLSLVHVPSLTLQTLKIHRQKGTFTLKKKMEAVLQMCPDRHFRTE